MRIVCLWNSIMLARAALGSIWVYQTYISPRKGFRCAHSVVHSGTGCSGYAKQVIIKHGFFRAIPLIKLRFRDCKAAYLSLSSDQHQSEQKNKKKKSNRCSREVRDGCCDLGTYDCCATGYSCFGRMNRKATDDCATDCDVCSCG